MSSGDTERPYALAGAVLVGAVLLAASTLLLPGEVPAREQEAGEGRLVIMGGGGFGSQPGVYRAILDGRRTEGPVCVIPTASASPQRSMESAVEAFETHGGEGAAVGVATLIVDTPEAARDPSVVDVLSGCAGYYFVGGVQSRIVSVLRPAGRPTPAYDVLVSRYRDGAVVAGSSAGAAVMSDPMIAGGASGAMAGGVRRAEGAGGDEGGTGSPEEGSEEGSGERLPLVSIEPGLGFFSALVDQHHLARGRFGRLLVSVLELEEYDLGFGIDESTALVVDGGTARVVGASGVVVVDGTAAGTEAGTSGGVRLHLMSAGDRFDLDARRLQIDPSKEPLPPGPGVSAPDDLFERWVFFRLLDGFARSPRGEIALPVDGGGRIVLRKGPDFEARGRAGEGPGGTTPGLAVRGLELELRRGS